MFKRKVALLSKVTQIFIVNLSLALSNYSLAERVLSLVLGREEGKSLTEKYLKIPIAYINNPGDYANLNMSTISALAHKDVKLENFIYNLKNQGINVKMNDLLTKLDLVRLKELYLAGLVLDGEVAISIFKSILKSENPSDSFLLPIQTPTWQLFTSVREWRFIFENYSKIDQQYFLEAIFITNSPETRRLIAEIFPRMLLTNSILNLESSTEEYVLSNLVKLKALNNKEIRLFKELAKNEKSRRICELRLLLSEAELSKNETKKGVSYLEFIKDMLELNFLSEGSFGDEYAKDFILNGEYLDKLMVESVLKNLPTFKLIMIATELENEERVEPLERLLFITGVSATSALKECDKWLKKLCKAGHPSITEGVVPADKNLLCYLNIDNLSRFSNTSKMRSDFENYIKENFSPDITDYLLTLHSNWEGDFSSLLLACQREMTLN